MQEDQSTPPETPSSPVAKQSVPPVVEEITEKMPRDEEHESIQTRSKATQSLFGNEVLESVNLVAKEGRKIENLLLEMESNAPAMSAKQVTTSLEVKKSLPIYSPHQVPETIPFTPSSALSHHARQAAQEAGIKWIILEEDYLSCAGEDLLLTKTIEEKIQNSNLSELSRKNVFNTLHEIKDALELKRYRVLGHSNPLKIPSGGHPVIAVLEDA
eukprot:augustus_masked-scaffold_8-processed-gene-14.92-mRNA-1 protein AED:1.00 eAED:1.00 QI:0/-1/0/0/-1/1/1/0/213